jgi:CRP-like cAMP-binding protein
LATRLLHLLPGVSEETIERLAEVATVRSVRPGDVIYRQGEEVPLTLILDGYGIARRATIDGHEIMSGVAPPGVVFGYSGIAGEHSSVEITALTNGEVAQWPGSGIRALIAVDAAFGLAAIDSMGASLHETVERIEGFLHQDARRRVVRILARHRELFFGEPAVLDRTHLPGLVGTTREMTRRVLRKLEQEGAVQRVGATGLRLLRPDLLEGS